MNPDDIAALSPHRRDNVLRSGGYDTAILPIPPGPYDSTLRLPADGLWQGQPRLTANRNTAGTGSRSKYGHLRSVDPQECAVRKGGSAGVSQSYRLEGTTGPPAIRTWAS